MYISFRRARNLSSYLVSAKLYPLERQTGSRKCKKASCQVCDNISETNKFASSVTGEEFLINHKLNCSDKCLIYLLCCKVCDIQYMGETTNYFRHRWNNYKSNHRKACKGEVVSQAHFYLHISMAPSGNNCL